MSAAVRAVIPLSNPRATPLPRATPSYPGGVAQDQLPRYPEPPLRNVGGLGGGGLLGGWGQLPRTGTPTEQEQP